MTAMSGLARTINAAAVRLIDAPVLGGLVRRVMIMIRYQGRRSGKTFETPIWYRSTAGGIKIGVAMPDSKQWWRNFLDEGGPITLVNFRGADRSGHAVAHRDERGRVTVSVQLA